MGTTLLEPPPLQDPLRSIRDTAANPAAETDPLSLSPETKASIQVLIIDDERTLRESCASMLKHDGFSVHVCRRGDEALDELKRSRFDIVLLDLYMSQIPGMELLRAALETHPETIVIVMTGQPSVTSNLEALEAGAWDYLPKPFSATQLQILLGRAAHTVIVGRETRDLQGLAGQNAKSDKIKLIGQAPAFRRVIELARQVAETDASVFITGESGVGKEQIAQFIHHHGRRSSRPLVAVNCAALPEALLESEMFGHVKGAFTGAVRDKPGLLEMANGGTLFLDELIEMPKPIQAKLLRVIQDGVVRRVGSERTDAVVNVRFIACTNCNPEEALRSGQLREDLYYRLRVVPIQVPPLRDRPEDIPLLANHFLALYWQRHRGSDARPPKLSEAAIRELRSRPWKGNVRELQNVVEHMVVLLRPGAEVQPEHIPVIDGQTPTHHKGESASAIEDAANAIAEGYRTARERLLGRFERQFLQQLVTEADGNISRAARIARLNRTTLYRLMERYGLQRRLLACDPADEKNGSPADYPVVRPDSRRL